MKTRAANMSRFQKVEIKKILIFLGLLATTSIYALDCRDQAFDQNWPEDKINRVIRCDKIESKLDYFKDDILCLNIRKTQISNFEDTIYRLELVTNGYDYPLALSSIVVNKQGKATFGSINTKENGDTELLGDFVINNWKVSAKLNIKNPDELKLKVQSKFLLLKNTQHEATYRCEVVL